MSRGLDLPMDLIAYYCQCVRDNLITHTEFPLLFAVSFHFLSTCKDLSSARKIRM